MKLLLEAAKAVLKFADFGQIDVCTFDGDNAIETLRQAVQDAEVYTPMTDDEIRPLMGVHILWLDAMPENEKANVMAILRNGVQTIEAEVIKRAALRVKESK